MADRPTFAAELCSAQLQRENACASASTPIGYPQGESPERDAPLSTHTHRFSEDRSVTFELIDRNPPTFRITWTGKPPSEKAAAAARGYFARWRKSLGL